MSREINLDLRKPLSKLDPADLRYACDRNLLDPADQMRVERFLKGDESAEEQGSFQEEIDEEKAELLAILNGSVGEVIARVEDTELTEEEVQTLIEAEEAKPKPRKGVLEYFQAFLETFEEEEEEDADGEGDDGDDSDTSEEEEG